MYFHVSTSASTGVSSRCVYLIYTPQAGKSLSKACLKPMCVLMYTYLKQRKLLPKACLKLMCVLMCVPQAGENAFRELACRDLRRFSPLSSSALFFLILPFNSVSSASRSSHCRRIADMLSLPQDKWVARKECGCFGTIYGRRHCRFVHMNDTNLCFFARVVCR